MMLGSALIVIGGLGILVFGFHTMDVWTDMGWRLKKSDEFYEARKAFARRTEFLFVASLIFCLLGAYQCS
jgi:hypothetical protein